MTRVIVVYGLAYGDGQFVATGAESEIIDQNGDALGVIYASDDGVAWNRVANELPTIPWDVSYGNGRFVGVGSHITNTTNGFVKRSQAFVSEDGRTWTTVDLADPFTAFRSAFGNGVFVAAGETAHWRSSDGIDWVPSGPAHGLEGGVEFANGKFVSWNRAQDLPVSTGTEWQAAYMGSGLPYPLFDLTVVNDRFVGIIQSDCCAGEIPEWISWGKASSLDGEHWTIDETGLTEKPLMLAIDDSICVALGDDGVHSGSDCDSLELTFAGDSFVPARALGVEGIYLVAGTRGLLSSADGVHWDRAIWSDPEPGVGRGE